LNFASLDRIHGIKAAIARLPRPVACLGYVLLALLAVVAYYAVTLGLLRLGSPRSLSTESIRPFALLPALMFCSALLFRSIQVFESGFPGLVPAGLMLLRSFSRWLRLPAVMFAGGLCCLIFAPTPAYGWVIIWIGYPLALAGTPRKRAAASGGTGSSTIRGTDVLSPQQAVQIASTLSPGERAPVNWSGLTLSERITEGHFAVIGATGSGKTISLRLLMQSVLPHIGSGSDMRALVYDAKRDMVSILNGLPLRCPVVILNPFDARSVAWDMARDITAPATAHQVASILIPEEQGHNRFFSDAARHLLAGVFIALMNVAPKAWTLRDVVLIMSEEERLRKVLQAVPHTRSLVNQYLRREGTAQDIQSSIATRIAMFEPIAALWHKAPVRISLEGWVNGNFILVLGNEESLRAPLDALNRVIFQRLTELVLNGTESTRRRSWFFLDEVKEAGKLDGLSRLLTKGRSKGARVVLGFQDIEGLRSIYGELAANELAGMCANKAILRIDSEATARWAAQSIGESLFREFTSSTSETRGKEHSTTSSTQEHITQRQAVLASQLMRLPVPDASGFYGYYVTPAVGVYHNKVSFLGKLRRHGRRRDFEPRPTQDQYVPPWAEDDAARVGVDLATVEERAPTQAPTPAPEFVAIPRITRAP
jgi:hypothetical protein